MEQQNENKKVNEDPNDENYIRKKNRETLSRACVFELKKVMNSRDPNFDECYNRLYKVARQFVLDMRTKMMNLRHAIDLVSPHIPGVVGLFGVIIGAREKQ
ncbi:MAG: hypothetical protein EZS28_005809 [Streblomastix strix]|uniref:Uncharacterized protein n=1 Tax=Streblomastix strix TaxID=222440 RepID=A0A5J4WUS2_9EUKA|nr:MAG: hypothetical protein EZS28_005809 [Streblomastix strix]